MFGNSKPAASLSSGLLARKGQAKPAMRPQGYVGLSPVPSEDLGWNDMGHDLPPMEVQAAPAMPIAPPPVIRQIERIEESFAAAQPVPVEPEPEIAAEVVPEPIAPAASLAPEPRGEVAMPVAVHLPADATVARLHRETRRKHGKAAFTLRLDADRHLRLRLASAVTHRSSQQIVSDALDAYLSNLPEIDELASRLPGARTSLKGK